MSESENILSSFIITLLLLIGRPLRYRSVLIDIVENDISCLSILFLFFVFFFFQFVLYLFFGMAGLGKSIAIKATKCIKIVVG
jgi:hypothetical protein